MPVLENSIGGFPMLALFGTPQVEQQELEILRRPGLNGVGFRRLGVRGEPFTLTSLVDVGSHALGKTAIETYAALVGGAFQTLIKNDVNWGQYEILRVRLVELRAVANFAGGINPPSLALVTAEWTLQEP